MDKTAQLELDRLFLVERLPEPLTPASSHIQIFDNYVENTRLRIRQLRDPYANVWTRILQQVYRVGTETHMETHIAEIYLDEEEYNVLEPLEGREIRKNRYFHEFDRVNVEFDVYLGPLWGLTTAKVVFHSVDELLEFIPPPFAAFEVTWNPYFQGNRLVDQTFDEVRRRVSALRPVNTDDGTVCSDE